VSRLALRFLDRVRVLAILGAIVWLRPETAGGLDFREIDAFEVPTNATMMLFAPEAGVLILKNSGSAVAAIDVVTRQSILRLANGLFTDITLSPSRTYAFLADYGGENIGYGTPAWTSYVHRLELFDWTWDVRSAYIAGNVQAISDVQLVLKSLDQWVSFTNNAWGSGDALIPLNTPTGWIGPAWWTGVYEGDFRWDYRRGRLIHGNSGLSSQEIQVFRIVGNNFVKQEGSGTYGTASGYGGTVVLATDGSAFYYGRLQVDPLDVTHNTLVFPELIYAANGRFALGDGNVYHTRTGTLLGALPFRTTVYAMNPEGEDFWAYDPLTTTVHHFVPASSFYTVTPCRLVDTRDTPGPFGGPALQSGASRTFVLAARCGIPATASALAANVAVTEASSTGFLTIYPADEARPLTSNINFVAGKTLSNNATLKLGPDGDVTVYCGQGGGTAHAIIDVTGYYQ
jgi:hypothetical protein